MKKIVNELEVKEKKKKPLPVKKKKKIKRVNSSHPTRRQNTADEDTYSQCENDELEEDNERENESNFLKIDEDRTVQKHLSNLEIGQTQ